jgi:type I restriction enzyme S subunit
MTELSWPEVTLEDVAADVTVGFVGPMAHEYVESGIPFLRSLNVEPFRINTNDLKYIGPSFHQKIRKSALTPGDVVIVRTGKPGACAVVPEWLPDANCSDLVVVRPGPTVSSRYLSYVVNSVASHHVEAFTVGAVQQHFNVGAARKIRFRLPPPLEQDRIVALLGALDDKIELNRRMNETLEAMARAIFQDWFVAFGPTRAKMEGRPPYLAPDLWSLFPDRLDADGKPEGWENETLARVADLNPESWSSRTMPSAIEYLDLAGCKRGEIQELQTLAREAAPSRAQRVLRPGDTVVGTVRPGNRSFALIGRDGITGSTGFAVLRPKHAGYREFLYLAATADDAIAFLAHRADGAAYPAVRPDVVVGVPIVWASHSVLLAFSGLVAPLIDRTIANRAEAQTLAATRDLLLPRLMSGELRVKDAERFLERVV